MGGVGRPPKGIGNRRRYGQPTRGEWTDLEDEVLEPVLPVFHRDMTCPQWMWEAWRWDPVTLVYTKADVAFVCELGHRYANYYRPSRDADGIQSLGYGGGSYHVVLDTFDPHGTATGRIAIGRFKFDEARLSGTFTAQVCPE